MTAHAGHGSRTCQYGVVHARCRCPEHRVVKIQCPTPEVCSTLFDSVEPRHRKEGEAE